MQELKLIKHTEIDREKWDNNISNATNSRIYAKSWYLEQLNSNWCGLVYGDYEYIMPVFKARKYGLNYIYQPTYAQQHGIFPNPTPEITALFFKKLSELAPYITISLNSENEISQKKFNIEKKPNYILHLIRPYEKIRAKYSKSHKRYINQAIRNINISKINFEQYIELKKLNSTKYLNEKTIETLRKIIVAASEKKLCTILGAFSEDNILTAGSVFINANNRILYINAVSNPLGIKLRAMYAIVDHIISENAEKELTLDFEGSSISGVADFFSRFGAQPEYYTVAKRNSIPILKHFIK
jgi:hypothetical protein